MARHCLLITLFSFQFVNYSIESKYDWKCTDEFCQGYPCPKLPVECKDSKKALLVPSIGPCNCCEHCFLFQKEGENCLKSTADFALPSFICAPHLICNESRMCEKMRGEDSHFFPNYECDENEICRCYAITENGAKVKIFGEFKKSDIKEKEKQCECSIVAYKARTQHLRALPFNNAYQPSIRCSENGQFEALQCINDKCGCVERDTGTPDENGFVFSLKALEPNHPICFDQSKHKKGQYYTECEKRRNKLMQDINEGIWNNITIILSQSINCNPDGTYAN